MYYKIAVRQSSFILRIAAFHSGKYFSLQPICARFDVLHLVLFAILQPYPGPIFKLPELPASRSNVNENLVLKNVNKLREYLFKSLNGVVFDDQVIIFLCCYFYIDYAIAC